MQNNPAQNAPEIILPMERLDQVLFNLDTSHIKDTLLGMNPRYPFISEVLLQQMLAIDSSNIEAALLSFLTAYRPIFTAVQKINAPVSAHPRLQTLLKTCTIIFQHMNCLKKSFILLGLWMVLETQLGRTIWLLDYKCFWGILLPGINRNRFKNTFPLI